MEKKQTLRFSDEELLLIKNTFAENEFLLKAIRKIFLQIPLSMEETLIVDQLRKQKSLLAVIRKSFLPTIDGDAPIHQVLDLWATLKLEGKRLEDVTNEALSREKLIAYLDEQLQVLEGKKVKNPIIFSDLVCLEGKDELEIFVDLNVRNIVIAHTELQLNQFLVLAGLKEESVEKTKEKLWKNSAK